MNTASLKSVAAMLLVASTLPLVAAPEGAVVRTNRFAAADRDSAAKWQAAARERLFACMMGGGRPEKIPLAPEILRREASPDSALTLEEIALRSLPDRRVHAWVAVPGTNQPVRGGVLALHGHGGTGEQVVRGQGLYWYGKELASRGYVVISPDIGSHALQHTNWSLMGERVWDALRCVDYLETRPECAGKPLAVAGLSLGGETTMYVAALDERLKSACSSGWLTTVANMKNGHCPCWDFPGLEANFDFADIFACVAPRSLVLEIGELERAPGGFPVGVARTAYEDIRRAYDVWNAGSQVILHVHKGGHVFEGSRFRELLERTR